MFSQFGPLELGIVLLIVLVIFGPKRLPGLGKQLGSGMREFKDSITGDRKRDDDEHGELGASAQDPVSRASDTKAESQPQRKSAPRSAKS